MVIKNKLMKHCPYCLAYYSDNVKHVCPPWLKEIVRLKKEKDKHSVYETQKK